MWGAAISLGDRPISGLQPFYLVNLPPPGLLQRDYAIARAATLVAALIHFESWAGNTVQWKGTCLAFSWPCFNPRHHVWSPEHHEEQSLCTELRVAAEHYHIWSLPPNSYPWKKDHLPWLSIIFSLQLATCPCLFGCPELSSSW